MSVELGQTGCDDVCTLEGFNATCRARILWTAIHEFPGQHGACALAYDLVAAQCRACTQCIPENVCDAEYTENVTVLQAATAVAQEANQTAVQEDCATVCTLNGLSVSCHDRVRWATHHEFKEKKRSEACRAAHHLVVSQCPNCEACTLEAVGCEAYAHCDRVCELGGKLATCAERTRWSAQHKYNNDPAACTKSHKKTLRDCTECSDCPIEGTDCDPPMLELAGPLDAIQPAVEFNCNSGDDSSAWSDAKVDWCCKNKRLGCPIPTSQPYNCQAGLRSWRTTWSVFKKAWCCANQERGCPSEATGDSVGATAAVAPTTTALPTQPGGEQLHDCKIGRLAWKTTWSFKKQAWCCQHEGSACHPRLNDVVVTTTTLGAPHDCVAGFAHWKEVWSQDKKDWCCKQKNLGCETMKPGDPFDCDSGDCGEWPSEKTWWCNAKRRGSCPMSSIVAITSTRPFSCKDGLSTWQGWSYEKKDWCCNNEALGCPTLGTSVHSYGRKFGEIWQGWHIEKSGLMHLAPSTRYILYFVFGSLGLALVLMVIRGVTRKSYSKLRQRDLQLVGLTCFE